jgi:hypothetical protein
MSTAELVEQVKAMPPRERRKLVEIIFALEEERLIGPSERVRWPDAEARAKRIFGNKIMPNLVLLERSS